MLTGLFVLAIVVLLVAVPDVPARWYLLGVVHTAAVAAVLHLMQSAFLAHEREAIWHVRGAWGEENTRDVLRQAKRRRLVWGWVDSITTQGGDIDHLVLTRAGGLVVLDSKWRNQADRASVADMARSAHRARGRAQGVAQTVTTRDTRGRRRAPGGSLAVRPAVVLWGAAQHAVPDGTEIEGVAFIPGTRLLGWFKQQGGDPVSKSAAADLLGALEEFRTTAWQDPGDGARRGRS
ncbi:MAG: nuclease-related domain-containing protein [Nocardioides sp.]|nr:nuclease-related domain-containing protein [Nocardioides sp.]